MGYLCSEGWGCLWTKRPTCSLQSDPTAWVWNHQVETVICVWDKDTVGALKETVEWIWQTTCGMVVSLHLPKLLILERPRLAAVPSAQSANIWDQKFTEGYTFHFCLSIQPDFLWHSKGDSNIFQGVECRSTERAGRGYEVEGWDEGCVMSHSSCSSTSCFPLSLSLASPPLPLHHSLSSCPSTSSRFLIKENISLRLPVSTSPSCAYSIFYCPLLHAARESWPGSHPSAWLWNLGDKP